MKPQIVKHPRRFFAGMVYYGALTGPGWSEENPIGQLWERFSTFWDAHGQEIADHVINPAFGYELNIYNETESEATGRFYTFVGVEVRHLDFDLPPQLVGKSVPATDYAFAVVRGEEIRRWEKVLYEEWLPASGYEVPAWQTYRYQIQAYEDGRFHGVGEMLAQSEVDVYVPVRPVGE